MAEAQSIDNRISELIAYQNDLFRAGLLASSKRMDAERKGIRGHYVFTPGFEAVPALSKIQILKKIVEFSDFEEENDPYGQHDFGAVKLHGYNIFWKIDYYDLIFKGGSENPHDPEQTRRVLTVMLASEY
ncbi:hypothetical protein MXMO3_03463 (plasmid) [Maritalea myrionectae]|uniref:DUF3768 domain-containing protein n=1 Tax=Maritalea myrionectae TaxID=454601 RepID=A0A2R4MJ62_9HYPH|nr:DUF3768 domain-containing protein [Maritalea myrionectae]AVX05966.1 hypothetical protein MXMO3_03463 [Maritalea myrionectae]